MPPGEVILDGGDETAVVKRVIRGDRPAFEQLVRRYQGGLYRYLYHLLGGDRGRAEELTQETFLKVFCHITSYDPERKFSTWLFAIARNLAFDDLKRSRPLPFSSFSETDDGAVWIENRVAEERTPATICIENEEQHLIMKAVSSLPPDYRDVVILRYFEGLPYLEIAEILGCPVTTIKIRLFRAKKRLLGMLGEGAVGEMKEEGRLDDAPP
jgi:RNA polymerase sigma-70 factor (ECF subfamily)